MYTTPYVLPVAKTTVCYTDFNNSMLFDVIRCLTNNNTQQIEACFDDMLKLMGVDTLDVCNMDKFCLLMDIRSMFLGDQLEIQTTNEKKVKVKISTMLNNIATFFNTHSVTTTVDVGDVAVDVGLPRNMLMSDYNKLVEMSITCVHHNNEAHKFQQFTPLERETFIDSLPAESMHIITQHIKHVQQSTSDLYLIPHNESIGLEGVKIGVYDNSMTEILRSLFAEDLMNFYEMQFSLVTKMRVTYDHFMKMTPSESKIYVNLYNKDIKKQEDAMNKQQQSGHSGRGVGGV